MRRLIPTKTVAAIGGALVIGSATLVTKWIDFEGTRYPVYLDIGGVPTVCEGHTGPDVKLGDVWTPEQCNAVLAKNVDKFSQGVLGCVKVALTQNEFDAFVLFAANVGLHGFCNQSRAIRELNAGRKAEACNALAYNDKGQPAWSYVGKRFVPGLHRRRLEERALCLTPTPKPEIQPGPSVPVPEGPMDIAEGLA